MAQRYGGKYSPDGSPDGSPTDGPNGAPPPRSPFDGKRVARAGARVNLLFFAPLPLMIRAFMQDASGLALTLGGFALLMLAAWMTREGLLAEEAYDARKIARRPALPRKMLGSVLTGLGLALAAFADGGAIVAPVLLGGLGFALHLFAFGPDPMRDKGMEGVDTYQQDRVARAVGEAEKHLTAMSDAILRARDRKLEARVEKFQQAARVMFRAVEDDPRDLTASRKYLGVYLLGARDATAKFADLYARTRDAKAREDYLALLDDLEKGFALRTEALLDDNRTDLDIEIDVLRERLEREGIHAE